MIGVRVGLPYSSDGALAGAAQNERLAGLVPTMTGADEIRFKAVAA